MTEGQFLLEFKRAIKEKSYEKKFSFPLDMIRIGHDCPITLVARKKGIDCDFIKVSDVGKKLGMDIKSIHRIIKAADGYGDIELQNKIEKIVFYKIKDEMNAIETSQSEIEPNLENFEDYFELLE